MRTHPYLRAFLAGVFVPTLILPLMLTAFILLRLVFRLPVPIERGLVFPMALVPLLWGVWNMLWLASHARTHLGAGPHGALLPFIFVPGGTALGLGLGVLSLQATHATWFSAITVPYAFVGAGFVVALTVYYLVWKYVVAFVNRELGIA